MDILEQGGQSNYNRSQFDPRRQQFAGGYEQARSQQRQQPKPFYPYDQPAPPSLDKADYYSPQTSLEQHPRDIFTVNPYKPPKPWYRTTRGLVILFIVILLLIGAGVGIALGVRASMNKTNADKKGPQQGQAGTSGGVAPTGAQRGSEGESDTSLPALTTQSFLRLDPTSQASAPAPSQTNLIISLNVNPAAAASAIVQTRPAAPTPTRASRPAAAAGPTSSVDPACARFPFLPACRQR